MLHFLRYTPFDSLAAWRSLLRDAALLRNPARLPAPAHGLAFPCGHERRMCCSGSLVFSEALFNLIRKQVLSVLIV